MLFIQATYLPEGDISTKSTGDDESQTLSLPLASLLLWPEILLRETRKEDRVSIYARAAFLDAGTKKRGSATAAAAVLTWDVVWALRSLRKKSRKSLFPASLKEGAAAAAFLYAQVALPPSFFWAMPTPFLSQMLYYSGEERGVCSLRGKECL